MMHLRPILPVIRVVLHFTPLPHQLTGTSTLAMDPLPFLLETIGIPPSSSSLMILTCRNIAHIFSVIDWMTQVDVCYLP